MSEKQIFTKEFEARIANKSGEPPQEITDLADEFVENGLGDVAEYLRLNGPAATVSFIDGLMSEWADNDPEGFRLHNLQVARDMLTTKEEG